MHMQILGTASVKCFYQYGSPWISFICHGIILGMDSASGRGRHNITPPLIGLDYNRNGSWLTYGNAMNMAMRY